MSGIAAVVSLGHTPRTDGTIERAAAAIARTMAHRGAARRHVTNDATLIELGGAGRGDRERAQEASRFVAVFDARLDDRRGLTEALGAREATDHELMLLAWERWGEDLVRRVLGDFAGVIWDRRERELILLREGIGVRPLYTAQRGDLLLVASEMQALTASELGVPIALDPLRAALVLVEDYSEVGPTFLRGIDAVEPGSVERWSARGRKARRVWAPDPFASGQPSDPASCAERLREALDLAVRERMSTTGPTASTVSGGLDSSSVQVLAARAARAAGAAPPTILHLAFPGLACDEARFVGAVAEISGAELRKVDPREHEELTSPSQARVGELYDITVAMNRPLLSPELTPPGTVVLTGGGGDDLLYRTGQDCIDHLRRREIVAAVQAARHDARGAASPARYFLRQLGRLAIRGRARTAFRWIVPARRRAPPGWLVGRVQAELEAWHADRMRWREALAAPSEVQRRLALVFLGDSDLFPALGRSDHLGAGLGLDFRHPFYDRRVLEVLLGTPPDQRAGPRWNKGVLREAMRGLLPEIVRTRTDAADFSPFADAAIVTTHRVHYDRAFRESELERAGIVAPGALLEAMQPGGNLSLPWRAMAIEVAVRTIREARASNPQNPAQQPSEAP